MKVDDRPRLNDGDVAAGEAPPSQKTEARGGFAARLDGILAPLRFASANLMILLGCAALVVGGWAPWVVLAFALVVCSFADEIGADDLDSIKGPCIFCTINLYATLPLVLLLAALLLRFATGTHTLSEQFGAIYLAGYLFALVGATVAHELTHKQTAFGQLSAYVLLAFTFNTSFVIYHVYGHHRHVGGYDDASTARRGERPLRYFIPRTIAQQFTQAWRIEAERLTRKGYGVWSWRNRLLQAQAGPVLVIAISALAAGWSGVIALACAGLVGRFIHELVNYVQHYGLVRAENSPIRPHHSWDCYRRVSNALNYNLPRHADHHMFATKAFWRLDAVQTAPTLPFGYQTMATIALIPPVWRHIMRPLIKDWDERFASDAERALVKERGWDGLA